MITPAYCLATFYLCVISAVFRPAYISYLENGTVGLISAGFGANYIIWFALFAGYLAIEKVEKGVPIIIYLISCGFILLPIATLSWIAAALIAASLAYHNPHQRTPLILFTITALREPLTQICLKLFAGNILGVDALMTNIALFIMGQPTLIHSNIILTESGLPLLILTGCSVFTNLSYISLLWFSLHVVTDQRISLYSWGILSISIFITLTSNAFRLALMTQSQEDYLFYHDGLGSQLFQWGLMGGILLFVLGGNKYVHYLQHQK